MQIGCRNLLIPTRAKNSISNLQLCTSLLQAITMRVGQKLNNTWRMFHCVNQTNMGYFEKSMKTLHLKFHKKSSEVTKPNWNFRWLQGRRTQELIMKLIIWNYQKERFMSRSNFRKKLKAPVWHTQRMSPNREAMRMKKVAAETNWVDGISQIESNGGKSTTAFFFFLLALFLAAQMQGLSATQQIWFIQTGSWNFSSKDLA